MEPEKRSRRFCITWNNYPEGCSEKIKGIFEKFLKYIVVGLEVGEQGTKHLQIYCEYKHGKTLKSVRKHFEKCHVECAKGSAEDNYKYCTKDGNFYELGEFDKQGQRNDLSDIRESIENGDGSVREMVRNGKIKNYQSLRMAENLMKYLEPKRLNAPKIIWRWGDPGCGKTAWVYERYDDPFVPVSYKWWEGYDGHKTVLIDDLRGNWCTWSEFLKLIDRYPFRVECKGGSRQLLAENIIITAPFPPCDIWKTIENKTQLYRRITEVHKCYTAPDEAGPANLYCWEEDKTDYASLQYFG